MFQAVFFDIDGTLVNSLENYLQTYKKVLEHFGFNFPDNEVVKRCFGRTEETICKGLDIPEKAEEFRNIFFELVRKALPNLQLFPDAIDTLTYLKSKQIKIGFITFGYDWYINKLAKLLDLNKYTQIVISFNDVQNPKPHPEAVIKACNYLGLSRDKALIVGDSKNDILMGKNARSKTALYTPKENKKFYNFEELIEKTHPDFIIKHLAEINSFIH